ncbi:MAG: 50S ribosomal protein L4 [Candidatus Beckwithbacteria bacterium]|nr:50S ribosomal protein L4 [Candidatus Beckwithbacteria bacterium]
MLKIDVYSTSGTKLTPLTVSEKIFGAKINQNLMAQAVRVYLANQRLANAQTKRRGDVDVTKAKVWRQKGTGRARHGSRNAPIFVGGGKAHGPTGTQNYTLKFPQKMKQLSLFSALTTKFKNKEILVVDGLDKVKAKTKAFDKIFHALIKSPKKLLLLLDKTNQTIKRGSANLEYLTLSLATSLNTYQALNSRHLIFTKEALKALEKHYVA